MGAGESVLGRAARWPGGEGGDGSDEVSAGSAREVDVVVNGVRVCTALKEELRISSKVLSD